MFDKDKGISFDMLVSDVGFTFHALMVVLKKKFTLFPIALIFKTNALDFSKTCID